MHAAPVCAHAGGTAWGVGVRGARQGQSLSGTELERQRQRMRRDHGSMPLAAGTAVPRRRNGQGGCALRRAADDSGGRVGAELGRLGERRVVVGGRCRIGVLRVDLRMHVQGLQGAHGSVDRVVCHRARLDDHAGRQVVLGATGAGSCTRRRHVCKRFTPRRHSRYVGTELPA